MGAVGYGGRSMRQQRATSWGQWSLLDFLRQNCGIGLALNPPTQFWGRVSNVSFSTHSIMEVGVCGNRGLLVRPMEGGRREAGWESQWQRQWRTPSPRAAPAPQLYRHPCSKSTSSRDDPPAQVPSLTQAVAQSDTIGTDHCRWPHHLKPICAFHPHKEPKSWPKTSAEGITKVWCKLRYKLSATKLPSENWEGYYSGNISTLVWSDWRLEKYIHSNEKVTNLTNFHHMGWFCWGSEILIRVWAGSFHIVVTW